MQRPLRPPTQGSSTSGSAARDFGVCDISHITNKVEVKRHIGIHSNKEFLEIIGNFQDSVCWGRLLEVRRWHRRLECQFRENRKRELLRTVGYKHLCKVIGEYCCQSRVEGVGKGQTTNASAEV